MIGQINGVVFRFRTWDVNVTYRWPEQLTHKAPGRSDFPEADFAYNRRDFTSARYRVFCQVDAERCNFRMAQVYRPMSWVRVRGAQQEAVFFFRLKFEFTGG